MSESPTADLRALAGRLGLLSPCQCRNRAGRTTSEACWVCVGTGLRLPTEAECRAAIREAGHFWVEVGANQAFAGVAFGGDEGWRATATASDTASEPDLVLLALLRALEAARGA